MAVLRVLGGFFKSLWQGFDIVRKVLHLFVLIFVVLVLVAVLVPAEPPLPRSAALVLNPTGTLVEQLDGDALSRALDEASGSAVSQTRVRDILKALEAAKEDERIELVVLDLDNMWGAGLTKLQAIGEALDDFKESGKQVLAYGDNYTQGQYFIAAHADAVYLHPSGFLFLQGYGRYRRYYKSAIDKLLLDWNVFKVGNYKSFVEPYFRDDMSPADRESSSVWLGQLWQSYKTQVAAARGIESGDLQRYSEEFLRNMQSEGGDAATLAVAQGLVDDLMTRGEFRRHIAKLLADTPATDDDDAADEFKTVGLGAYARSVNGIARVGARGGDRVGVIVAVGDILNGSQPPGSIGGDSTAELVAKARKDDDIKAVVLRVDSGGGSKFASEVIERELRMLEEAGKPLIVSMGSVAASGGYWIALPGREIYANPDTLTGSIGIGAYFPTAQRTLDKLGMHTDGVGTTPWSGEFRPDREMSEAAKGVLQSSMEFGYRQFVGTVAQDRDMSFTAVDEIAQGRVWTGRDAHRLGLVDVLGELDEAIESAAQHAGLDDYKIEYIERETTLRESLGLFFATRLGAWFGATRESTRRGSTAPVTALLRSLHDDVRRLERFDDPRHLYAHCFCSY